MTKLSPVILAPFFDRFGTKIVGPGCELTQFVLRLVHYSPGIDFVSPTSRTLFSIDYVVLDGLKLVCSV